MKERIVSFDAFRFILALCVVLGHSYVVLYQVGPSHCGVQNIAVDGFFILSGFLMAASLSKIYLQSLDINNLFIEATKKRFCRLWPEYFFALFIVFVLTGLFFHRYDWYALPFNLVLISQIDKVPGIITGSWYVSVLFWGGAILSYLLLAKQKSAVSFWLPMVIFLSFGYIFPVYNHLSLHGTNLFLFDAYSMGLIKGLMDMAIGMECYFVSQYFKTHDITVKDSYKKYMVMCFEVIGLYLMLYAWTFKGVNKTNFLVLFGYTILFIILYLHKETILKFLSWKMWRPVAPTAYMLFLTHVVWLGIIKSYIPYKNYPETLVYASVMIFCVVFAFICYHAQKWLFAKLKQMLFVPQDNLLEQHIENTMENSGGVMKLQSWIKLKFCNDNLMIGNLNAA